MLLSFYLESSDVEQVLMQEATILDEEEIMAGLLSMFESDFKRNIRIYNDTSMFYLLS